MRSVLRQLVIVFIAVSSNAVCSAAEFQWAVATPESRGMSGRTLAAMRDDRAAWMKEAQWGVMTHYLADWKAAR